MTDLNDLQWNVQCDNLNKWADQWDKAQQLEDFQDKSPEILPISGKVDFFGEIQGEGDDTSEEELSEDDTSYWKSYYNQMTYQDVQPSEASEEVLEEVAVVDQKKVAKIIQTSPNPVRPSTVGMDQDMTDPASLGATYDVGDLEKLETLKLKLHDLLSKLSTFESRSEAPGKLIGQIESLQKQIDEFSTQLSGTGGAAS